MYLSQNFNLQETFKEMIFFSFNQCHKIVRYDILLQDEKKDESNRMRDQTPDTALSFNSQIRHHEDGCHIPNRCQIPKYENGF